MRQHRGLLIAWTIVIAAFVAGIVWNNESAAFFSMLVAMLFALLTFRRSDQPTILRRPRLYRASVALLFLAAVTGLVSAGSTVFIDHHVGSSHIAGFAGLATTNLLLSILAWRALVKPTQRRAALAGLIAVVVETIAMLVDIFMNMERRVSMPGSIVVTIYACVIATWAGALACMASLATFEPADELSVPEARIVDQA